MANDDAGDRPAHFAETSRAVIATAYRPLVMHEGIVTTPGGPMTMRREIYEIGHVAALVPYDPVRELLVLQRQFRMGAHVQGENALLVEIAAGLIEDGENPATAAIRETEEELGITPHDLIAGPVFMPSTGWLGETAHLFAGRVDATALPAHAGAAGETEFTEPFAVSLDVALKALDEGRIRNGFTVLGLLWFDRHRTEIRRQWGLAS
jgi:ADP-ribose pyrophosphatase